MTNDKLIAALKRLANDRNSCGKCEFYNDCGVMHCEVAKLAAEELARLKEEG